LFASKNEHSFCKSKKKKTTPSPPSLFLPDHQMAARLYDVSNIIVSGTFSFLIDLEEVSTKRIDGISIEYKPLRFHAVLIRIHGISGTIYVFHDGNYLITGALESKDIDRLLNLCIPILQ